MQRLRYFLPRFTRLQRFSAALVGLLLPTLFLAGCGGSGSKASTGQGFLALQIGGIAQTSDVSLSANGSFVPVSNAAISVVSNATGKQAGQAQTGSDGRYDIELAAGGVYTVVPAPVTVGAVTLVAPTQQVTVESLTASLTNNKGAQTVTITYTRQ